MLDFLIWAVTALIRWFRLKVYQYEVTFALYMLTPTEKFIFNSVLLSLVSMIVTGAYIYLPDHIRSIYGHLYYYWAGDRSLLSSTNLPSFTSVFRDASAQNFRMVYDTAKNTAAATTESMAEL